MDMKALLRTGAEAFLGELGSGTAGAGNLTLDRVMEALAKLLPGDGDHVDLGRLVGRMQEGGLAAMAQSWLEDGDNRDLSGDDVKSMLGGDAVRGFAERLGLSEPDALQGLRGALPKIVDRASSGGALDILEGASGLLGAAGSLFGR
jgi:uncharacterized protein YidB (DUF937 family)